MKKKILALLAFTGASLGICLYLNNLKKSKNVDDSEKEEATEEESEEYVDLAN